MAIYDNAQTHLREPRHLEQLIRNFDEMDWFTVQKDGLGDLYEGLLEKNATETKSGAGQYFTPRALINAMVRCIKPQPKETIQDPAAGTAGFLIAADQYMRKQTGDYMDISFEEQQFQSKHAFVGVELVPNTRRLALMNCLLHDIEGGPQGAVLQGNTLGETGKRLKSADIILANPPFGTSKGGDAAITRDDLTYETTNKQLAFLQHIYRNLKEGGRAAVVLPDNVLFEAGKGTDIRHDLMNKCNLHTILRLPTGIFYAQGVKANVLFFTKGQPTKDIWFYDYRTDVKHTLATNKLQRHHLDDFVACYTANPRVETYNEDTARDGRWRKYTVEDIMARDKTSLDITWIKAGGEEEQFTLDELMTNITTQASNISKAVAQLQKLMAGIKE